MHPLSVKILILSLILSTCSQKETLKSIPMNTDYQIAVNESFQIELNSNPTTGYSWKWTNKDAVKIVETFDFQFKIDEPVLAGSGGKEIWKFKGLKSGTDTIRLEYCRPWDPSSTAASKNLVVTVK